jgi:hypothetical protein
MGCRECGKEPHPDRDGLCYRCSVAGIGIVFNGPIRGRNGWNRHTVGSFHQEHFGVSGARELARTNDKVQPYSG